MAATGCATALFTLFKNNIISHVYSKNKVAKLFLPVTRRERCAKAFVLENVLVWYI